MTRFWCGVMCVGQNHELSHNLCWDEDVANKLTAILSNFPTALPSAILFQK
jgi:hypothetical protein